LRIPTTIPETPRKTTTGKRTLERPGREILELAQPEDAHDQRRQEHEKAGDRAEDDEDEPEERRGEAPGAGTLLLFEELAEDGNESRP
jgi:hypothetical protein